MLFFSGIIVEFWRGGKLAQNYNQIIVDVTQRLGYCVGMMKNETFHLVEQPSLKVLNTFNGYTTEAIRHLSNANCCIRTSGVYYFGLYTTGELEQMKARRSEQ